MATPSNCGDLLTVFTTKHNLKKLCGRANSPGNGNNVKNLDNRAAKFLKECSPQTRCWWVSLERREGLRYSRPLRVISRNTAKRERELGLVQDTITVFLPTIVMAGLQVIPHANTAERFVQLCTVLDLIRPTYVRTVLPRQNPAMLPATVPGVPYLDTHLNFVVDQHTNPVAQPTRSGLQHVRLNRYDGHGRRDLPVNILTAIRALPGFDGWSQTKFELKWIVCYLGGIRPNQNLPGWQQFECSHRCIVDDCVTGACLTWESKPDNQSRGQDYCVRLCNHCGQCVCHCQGFHNPPCI